MAEPILWVNKAQRSATVVVDGEQRTERIPQRGHTGSSDYDRPELARFKRWERYIKACGTDARVPLTNAAAHLQHDDGYGKMIHRKGRALGWIPRGNCPCTMLLAGELLPKHIVDKSLLTQQPCAPRTYNVEEPCPHLLAEQKARQAAHTERERKRAISLKSEVEKLLEGQKEQTKEIVGAVATGMKEAIEAVMAAAPQQPKGKGGKQD